MDVDGGPSAFGIDTIEHGAVGVQVRVRSAIVEVIEPGDQQPFGLDLALPPAFAAAGVDHVIFDPLQCFVHGLLVGFFNCGLDLIVAQAPHSNEMDFIGVNTRS